MSTDFEDQDLTVCAVCGKSAPCDCKPAVKIPPDLEEYKYTCVACHCNSNYTSLNDAL